MPLFTHRKISLDSGRCKYLANSIPPLDGFPHLISTLENNNKHPFTRQWVVHTSVISSNFMEPSDCSRSPCDSAAAAPHRRHAAGWLASRLAPHGGKWVNYKLRSLWNCSFARCERRNSLRDVDNGVFQWSNPTVKIVNWILCLIW